MVKKSSKKKIKSTSRLKLAALIIVALLVPVFFKSFVSNSNNILGESDFSGNRGNSNNRDNVNSENGNKGKSENNKKEDHASTPIPLPTVSINNNFLSPPITSVPIPTPSLFPAVVDNNQEDNQGSSSFSDNSQNSSVGGEVSTGIIEINQDGVAPSRGIEVKSQDLKSSINLMEKGTVLQVQSDHGKITVTAKKSDGSEVKLDNQDFVNTLPLLNSTVSNNLPDVKQVEEGLFTLKFNNTTAETNIPLSIFVDNKVKALTNEGEKNIEFMPDEAVNILINKKIISGTKDFVSQLDEQGNIKSISRKIKLIDKDHKLVYEISGVSKEYVLGLIPVDINKQIIVSEETGSVLSIDQGVLDRLKDLISISR